MIPSDLLSAIVLVVAGACVFHLYRVGQLRHELEDARKQTLENAFLTNPNRFVKNIPSPPDKPTAVWINPPQIKPEIQA